MNNFCQTHNCELVYQEWVSKGGKTPGKLFKAWKCPIDKMCKSTIFVDDPKQGVYSPKKPQIQRNIAPKDEGYNNLMTANRELYILVKAIGITLMGKQAVPPESAIKFIEENVIMLKNKK